MRKSLFISAFLLLFPLLAGAQEASMPRLSDSAYASLITCGPGDEFYTTFGHSAIRINDSVNNIDVVYNYGTFDFDTPHFYWKFARGRLNYCLSRSSFDNFMFEYSMEGRAVWEQRLRLTSQELNNLFIALETNYMPQYRYYLYDFFRDNCATVPFPLPPLCQSRNHHRHQPLLPQYPLPLHCPLPSLVAAGHRYGPRPPLRQTLFQL